jgi:hypothetical protein
MALLRLLFGGLAFGLMAMTQPALSQVVPVRDDAMNNPHKHAWDLFLALNHPAKDPAVERGVADPTKRVGDPGLTVWETWKHARTEVFLDKGAKPAPWNVLPAAVGGLKPLEAKLFDVPKPTLLRALSAGIPLDTVQSFTRANARKMLADHGTVDPDEGTFDPTGFSGGGETRMNKATFEFVADDANQLYNIDGQEKFLADVQSGARKILSFPVDAMEVKAMWIELTDEDVKNGKDKRYHTGKDDTGKLFGLVALHIITKDVPNWFWTSFHQIDGKAPLVPAQDNFGRPKALDNTKWQFYALSGTQTDFVDSTGRATLLSDPYVENGFERSSCISCHSQASIGARPATGAGANRLAVFQSQRTNPDNLKKPLNFQLPPFFANIGPPFADQFYDSRGNLRYMQLDFLYSLHVRAKRKE